VTATPTGRSRSTSKPRPLADMLLIFPSCLVLPVFLPRDHD
jgi:hypothetical protein